MKTFLLCLVLLAMVLVNGCKKDSPTAPVDVTFTAQEYGGPGALTLQLLVMLAVLQELLSQRPQVAFTTNSIIVSSISRQSSMAAFCRMIAYNVYYRTSKLLK